MIYLWAFCALCTRLVFAGCEKGRGAWTPALTTPPALWHCTALPDDALGYTAALSLPPLPPTTTTISHPRLARVCAHTPNARGAVGGVGSGGGGSSSCCSCCCCACSNMVVIVGAVRRRVRVEWKVLYDIMTVNKGSFAQMMGQQIDCWLVLCFR